MPKYVNKESLSYVVSNSTTLTKQQSLDVVDLIFQEMKDALASDGLVEISGFGKFYIFDRKARMGINPVTMERMEIPSSKLPKFKPSQTLKNACNKKGE